MGIAIRSVLGEPPTGNAVPADVLAPKTFSNADGTDKVGTMTNNGAVSPTALDPGGSYTVPAGYHNGSGVVSAKSNTDTYVANSRGAALDMGAANLNRYVNTNGVPNSNSGTYTFPANDTGGTKDLGESNSYRYVNAQNVYNKGKADGGGQLKLSTPLWQTTGTNVTYTHNSSYSEALLWTAGNTTPTVTASSGVTVTYIGHPQTGFMNPYWYKLSGLSNGATVNIINTGGPSHAIYGCSNVNFT